MCNVYLCISITFSRDEVFLSSMFLETTTGIEMKESESVGVGITLFTRSFDFEKF